VHVSAPGVNCQNSVNAPIGLALLICCGGRDSSCETFVDCYYVGVWVLSTKSRVKCLAKGRASATPAFLRWWRPVVVKTDLSKNRCQQSCRACRSCTVAVSVRLTLPFIEVRFLYEDSLDLSIYRVKLISGVVAFLWHGRSHLGRNGLKRVHAANGSEMGVLLLKLLHRQSESVDVLTDLAPSAWSLDYTGLETVLCHHVQHSHPS
jgi:hypothetical protein